MPNAYRLAGTMTTCSLFSNVEMRLPYNTGGSLLLALVEQGTHKPLVAVSPSWGLRLLNKSRPRHVTRQVRRVLI